MKNDFDLILFGATGDLAMRKLFVSLFDAFCSDLLHEQSRIIATGRSKFDLNEFLIKLDEKSKIHIKDCDELKWSKFKEKISYLSIDINNINSFKELKNRLREGVDSIIYFSISPEFFAKNCENLAKIGLNHKGVRIVLEKPLGQDLSSFKQINESVAEHFSEEQIYRIDHYLGKQSVQNIINLRFANPLFEKIWNKDFIKNIQITVFEDIGVEMRGEFYDAVGALRDILQNHMLQMLSLVLMKRPQNLSADAIRAEKIKVLKNLKPFDEHSLKTDVIRAQYSANGDLKGYLDEYKIPKDSLTETYVAIKTELLNTEFSGVPIYLRTGKNMADNIVEIVVVFSGKSPLFDGGADNKLVIEIQPQNQISLNINAKKINLGFENKTQILSAKDSQGMLAYERLLLDVIDKNPTSFNHKDELEAAWAWLDPLLKYWQNSKQIHTYKARSKGPLAADELIKNDKNEWHH